MDSAMDGKLRRQLTLWSIRILIIVAGLGLPFLLEVRVLNYFQRSIRFLKKIPNTPAPNVTVWYSETYACRGVFNDVLEEDGVPLVLLREVLVDYRHASLEEHRINHLDSGPYRRLLALITVPPRGRIFVNSTSGPDPFNPASGASNAAYTSLFGVDGTPDSKFKITVDHVITNPLPCTAGCNPTFCAVKEWQVIMTLTSAREDVSEDVLERDLENFESSDGQIHLNIPMWILDRPVHTFRSRFTLGCVSGLTRSTRLQDNMLLPRRERTCEESHGAVMLGGGALVRDKKKSEIGWAEVGNFAARALMGQIRFDAVAVTVTVQHTASHMQHICKNDKKCFDRLHEENRALLNNIAERARLEMEAVGVPAAMWPRLFILPYCRLGSDHRGHEKFSPCRWSVYHGQYLQSTYLYSLFGPHFKYAASLDLDEFLVDRQNNNANSFPLPRGGSGAQAYSAERRFSSFQRMSDPFVLWFQWLDFEIDAPDHRALTKLVTDRKQPSFIGRNNTSVNVSSCFGNAEPFLGGKTLLSCDRGMGLRIHHPLIVSQRSNLSTLTCKPKLHGSIDGIRSSSIFAYHGRRSPRFGNCKFDPRVLS